jgi:glycosyltransferase involved in cell wall biosynthesis
LVTVVVTTRNRAHYLDDCLASLLRQRTGLPYEVVVVDNGSTDTTGAVLRRWAARDARLRTIREPQLGLSAGKNAGLRTARGCWILFTDDDVVVDAGWLEGHERILRDKGPRVMVGGPIVPVHDDLSAFPSWLSPGGLEDLGLLHFGVEQPLDRGRYVWGANLAASAELFAEVGPWNEDLGRRGEERGSFEDTEYQDRVRKAGGVVWFSPEPVLRHRIDRRAVVPRSVLTTAWTRGGNALLQRQAGHGHSGQSPLRQRALQQPLLAQLALFLLHAVLFRLRPSRATFERLHARAFGCGWASTRAITTSQAMLVRRVVRQAAPRLRSVALHVVGPGRSSGPLAP